MFTNSMALMSALLIISQASWAQVYTGVNPKTICGKNELQHVNEYNGKKAQPVEFIDRHESAVGALAVSNASSAAKYCSGTLISENLFLTAAHCINEDTLSHYAVFNYQKKRGSSALEKQEAFRIASIREQKLGGLDYAILKLSGTPGKKYGKALVNTKAVANGNILTIIQHPKGEPKKVDIGHKGQTGMYLSYSDLDTEPGSSGSGVLDQDGYVVAVHVQGGCGFNSGANRAVPMTQIVRYSSIIKQLSR